MLLESYVRVQYLKINVLYISEVTETAAMTVNLEEGVR